MKNKEFVIVDVETTGLSPSAGDRIVEIGALKIRDMKTVEEFHSLVDPEREISYAAFLVNGISQEMLEGAPKFSQVFPVFLKFVDKACLVGHNVAFDLGFLREEIFQSGSEFKIQHGVIDTLRMARSLLPARGSYSLAMVAGALGVRKGQQHRAMADVHLTFEVFHRLVTLAQEKDMADFKILARLFGAGDEAMQEEDQEKILLIEEAIEENKELLLSYFSAHRGDINNRKVTPKKLFREGRNVKLVGFCHLRNEDRDFRIDRILNLQKL